MNNCETTSINSNFSMIKMKKGISGSTLKIIGMITMLISHTSSAVLYKILVARGMYDLDMRNAEAVHNFYEQNALVYHSSIIMEYIGRLSFPIFCFLLIEGFLHTRNHWKYAMRIAIFALISELPFDMVIIGEPFYKGAQNVFFTLLIGLLVMIGFKTVTEKLRDKKWLPGLAVIGAIGIGYTSSFSYFGIVRILNKYLLLFGFNIKIPMSSLPLVIVISLLALVAYAIICRFYSLQAASVVFADIVILIVGMMLSDFFLTEYSAFGVLSIAVMYGLRKNHFKSMLGGCIVLIVMSLAEITALFSIIPAYFYNGQRGIKMKYAFYLFYPLHLVVLYLICYFMKIV